VGLFGVGNIKGIVGVWVWVGLFGVGNIKGP